MSTNIEWCDETVNPIVGCRKISKGCCNCYAEQMALRLAKMGPRHYEMVVNEGGALLRGWNGRTVFTPSVLKKPDKWKKPRRIFIGSMGDIFHETVWRCWLDEVLLMVANNPRHTFIMLTKRPQRMKEFFELSAPAGPPANLWLGVSVEDQATADARIPVLLSIPAAVRFISVEPMLGQIALPRNIFIKNTPELVLHWIIAGPENNSGKRPYRLEWFYDLLSQCRAAAIPFFLKTIDLEGIQVREFPA